MPTPPTLTPKARASLVRLVKGIVFGAAALAVGAVTTFVTGNGLELGPTGASIFTATAIPILAAAEKWITWQESQV